MKSHEVNTKSILELRILNSIVPFYNVVIDSIILMSVQLNLP